MKVSDGFDARRLRPRGSGNWRMRIVAAFAALLATFGVLLVLAGVSSLIGHPQALGELNASPTGAIVIVVGGLVALYLGVWIWRRSRRRQRHQGDLSLSPHLMKKHD